MCLNNVSVRRQTVKFDKSRYEGGRRLRLEDNQKSGKNGEKLREPLGGTGADRMNYKFFERKEKV